MIRTVLALSMAISTVFGASTFAQPAGRSGFDGARGGESSMPRAGTLLPEITLYDEHGLPFSTTSLRGQYSVLVFGCLT